MPKHLVGAYGRVSGRGQARMRRDQIEAGVDEDDTSLANQRKKLEAYVEFQDGWEFVEYYEDKAISGATMERPALLQMLEDIDNGRINTVLVWKIDRISRSLLDFTGMWEKFQAKGVTFVSMSESFDTSSAPGVAMMQILMVFAELERKQIGERTKFRQRGRAEDGRWNGGKPPFGYHAEEKKLVVTEEHRTVVELMFESYIRFKSTNQVADHLNATFPGVRPREWASSTIRNVLRNPVYTGTIRYRSSRGKPDEEVIEAPGVHEAIIDQGTFDTVQRILDENRNRSYSPNRKRKHNLALNGLVTCACGARFGVHAVYSKKKSGYVRYDYLQCSRAPRRKGGDGCKAKRVLGHKLEAAVFETLREACADDEVVSASLMELAKQHEKQLRQDDRRHKVLIRQRDRLKGQASKLMESFDADDLGLVKRKLSDLESRIEAVNLEIDEIEAKPPPVFPTPEQNRLIQEALEHFQVLYLQLTVPERRELFSIMFESIVWHSTHATVKLRGKSARKVPVGKGRYPLMDLLKEVPEGIEFRTQEVGGKKG